MSKGRGRRQAAKEDCIQERGDSVAKMTGQRGGCDDETDQA